MLDPKRKYYEKRAMILVNKLRERHFEAYYCEDRTQALTKAMELIPEGASVGWGGAMSAQQIGLLDAVKNGSYRVIDRDTAQSPEERICMQKECLTADVFVTGANALSMDGQMVNIDGTGNRVAAIVYGPETVLVIAGVNKIDDTLELAINRARRVAAPMNKQRFSGATPCEVTGSCGDCKSENCICNQILITRHCRPAGRIKFIIVGEELGL